MQRFVLSMMAVGALAAAPGDAGAQVLGSDASSCTGAGAGPAILATMSGFKDRTGSLKLELYPATEDDFLKDDRDLIAQGKTFRRVRAAIPPSGSAAMCIRVPRPGTYALFFTHDRDGKNKFNIWGDGAGLPSNRRMGRAKPKVGDATVTVGAGVTAINIRVQYLRGFPPSFGPIG